MKNKKIVGANETHGEKSDNTALSHSREKRGKTASFILICCNVLLAAGKMTVGALSGAVSVLADGLNNLSDCGSNLISYVSFKMAAKPADKEHPYGHQRIEYVASMIVAFLILVIAFELGRESVGKIFSPQEMDFSFLLIGVMIASVAVKLGMFFYARILAKKIDSSVLDASSKDSLSDCVATSAVLVSLVIGRFTGVNLDGYAGLVVALFVAWTGIGVLKSTMSKLIGQAPDPEILEKIRSRILSHEGVLGVHDVSVYSYGPNKYFASAHIETDASLDVNRSHEIVDEIEREFAQETDIALTGHLDPIEVNNPVVDEMRARVEELVSAIDARFSVHDFRMVAGQHKTNLIFEVAVPFDTKISESEVASVIAQKISEMENGRYSPVVYVEKQI